MSPYAVSKLAGEKYCFSYSHLYGLSTICLRFFTVYGPRQRPDLAIRKFAEKIREGKPIPFFGDGSTARDYTYVTDIVDGIMRAIPLDCRHEVMNLGNSNPITLARLVSTIEDKLQMKARLDRQPEQPGDVPITYADVSKAKAVLGYEPKMPFEKGIEEFVAWLPEPCSVL